MPKQQVLRFFGHFLSFQGPLQKKKKRFLLFRLFHQNDISRKDFGSKTKTVLGKPQGKFLGKLPFWKLPKILKFWVCAAIFDFHKNCAIFLNYRHSGILVTVSSFLVKFWEQGRKKVLSLLIMYIGVTNRKSPLPVNIFIPPLTTQPLCTDIESRVLKHSFISYLWVIFTCFRSILKPSGSLNIPSWV